MQTNEKNTSVLVLNQEEIAKAIDSIAGSILKKHPNPKDICLLGVHSGGDLLIRRIEAALEKQCKIKNLRLDKGIVDISFYRDDWSRLSQMPILRETYVPFDLDNKTIVLVDDVIFTGRTIRAALDAIFNLGRPQRVELAVLIKRDHREYPIHPDHVGLTMATDRHQSVNIYLHLDSSKDHAILEDYKYQTIKAS